MKTACRVCLQVGIDDPVAWMDTVSDETLTLWNAYYNIEPWGAEFERFAVLATQIANFIDLFGASHGAKRNGKPATMRDFMPKSWKYGRKTKKERRAEMFGAMKILQSRSVTLR